MKKIFLFVIGLFFIFSIAEAENEISFQGIPWLSDELVVLETLTEKGYIRNVTNSVSLTHDSPIYLLVDETGFVSPNHVTGAEDITFVIDLEESIKGTIAGYPVKDLKLVFAYDGTYHLIAVKVDLVKGDFEDINIKLKKVYGEGKKSINDEDIESIVWEGDNNSAVILYTQNSGRNYTLMYGRLDADAILSKCLEIDPNDVSGL